MLVTLLGISMLVRLLQPENAPSPMLVTLYVVPLYVISLAITIAPLIDLDCLATVAFPSFNAYLIPFSAT